MIDGALRSHLAKIFQGADTMCSPSRSSTSSKFMVMNGSVVEEDVVDHVVCVVLP